jgi:hypothetical protein
LASSAKIKKTGDKCDKTHKTNHEITGKTNKRKIKKNNKIIMHGRNKESGGKSGDLVILDSRLA